jgi:exodeoxyribonuclease V alpha subunit
LLRLKDGRLPWGNVDTDKAIPWVEEKTGLALSESQKNAVSRVLKSKVSVITGGPGVGKTTLVNSLLKILRAKRLTESTGLEARTVHRLLEFDP